LVYQTAKETVKIISAIFYSCKFNILGITADLLHYDRHPFNGLFFRTSW